MFGKERWCFSKAFCCTKPLNFHSGTEWGGFSFTTNLNLFSFFDWSCSEVPCTFAEQAIHNEEKGLFDSWNESRYQRLSVLKQTPNKAKSKILLNQVWSVSIWDKFFICQRNRSQYNDKDKKINRQWVGMGAERARSNLLPTMELLNLNLFKEFSAINCIEYWIVCSILVACDSD